MKLHLEHRSTGLTLCDEFGQPAENVYIRSVEDRVERADMFRDSDGKAFIEPVHTVEISIVLDANHVRDVRTSGSGGKVALHGRRLRGGGPDGI